MVELKDVQSPQQPIAADLSECRYCKGISLESLLRGYKHASNRASLIRSAQKCRLCSLFFRRERSRHGINEPLYLTLEPFSEDISQSCLRIRHGERDESRNELTFFLFTAPDDPSIAFGVTPKRELSSTQSEQSFDRAIKWLNYCKNNHICHKRLPLKDHDIDYRPWPSRLVDVNAFDQDLDVRLVYNDGSASEYICLSYCWGKSKAFTTTTRSLRLRKARISFQTMPKTFQDAVIITRRLGVRFLWIDALCIIQDDKTDWQNESAKMGAIYSMSYVTIAADSGRDCNSGCFNDSSTSQELTFDNSPFELRTTTNDGKESCMWMWEPSRGSQKHTPPEIDGSPLAERGWVCQERILSPRILHYTSTQLFWECRQTLLAEDNLRPWSIWSNQSGTVCGLARNLYGTTTDPIGQRNLLRIWYNQVVSQSYSRRKLTLSEDKLIALGGIARAFGRHFRTTYLAGLWQIDIAWGLSWRKRGMVHKPQTYRAPSFSWAAIDGPVEWPIAPDAQVACVEISEISVKHLSSDIYGRVASCSITLKGHLGKAKIAGRKRISAKGIVDITWELRSIKGQWLGNAFMDDDNGMNDAETLIEVDYIVLTHDKQSKDSQVLLFQKQTGEKSYLRIGMAEILGLEVETKLFDDSNLGKITLT